MTQSSVPRAGVLALAALALAAVPAQAESVEDFYKDNLITVVLGAGPGGGYDVYSRTVMSHLVNHIPGNPQYVLQFMPGAGGVKAANYFYTVAPRDGTHMAKLSNAAPAFQAVMGGVKYDASKLQYIGRAASMQYVIGVHKDTGVKSLEDCRKTEKTIVFGSTGKSQSNYVVPVLMQKVLGCNFRVIAGYAGTADINMALLQGEVHGRAGAWSSWIARGQEVLEKVNIIAQSGMEKAANIPGAPLMLDLAEDPDDKAILRLMASDATVGRNFSFPPGVPRERVEAVRAAFDATMKDPAFLADAEKRRLIIEPMTGARLQRIVNDVVATPKPLIERTKELLGW